ncbi:MAG: hypothetical protein EOM66_05860 [Clostridia bacterium]|nr:hypothetical protein [Clostridia bacterium]
MVKTRASGAMGEPFLGMRRNAEDAVLYYISPPAGPAEPQRMPRIRMSPMSQRRLDPTKLADWEIAAAAEETMKPIGEIARDLGLAADELIFELIIPRHTGCFMAFEKIGRRKALAISRINMGLLLEMTGSTIARAAVAYGAVGKTAYRVTELETFLEGKQLDEALIKQAGELAEKIVTEKLAGRKTTPYKRKIAAAVLRRALTRANGGAV